MRIMRENECLETGKIRVAYADIFGYPHIRINRINGYFPYIFICACPDVSAKTRTEYPRCFSDMSIPSQHNQLQINRLDTFSTQVPFFCPMELQVAAQKEAPRWQREGSRARKLFRLIERSLHWHSPCVCVCFNVFQSKLLYPLSFIY